MNPLMLAKKQQKLQQELEQIKILTTAPLRYIEYVKRHGTAMGKQYKIKKVA